MQGGLGSELEDWATKLIITVTTRVFFNYQAPGASAAEDSEAPPPSHLFDLVEPSPKSLYADFIEASESWPESLRLDDFADRVEPSPPLTLSLDFFRRDFLGMSGTSPAAAAESAAEVSLERFRLEFLFLDLGESGLSDWRFDDFGKSGSLSSLLVPLRFESTIHFSLPTM